MIKQTTKTQRTTIFTRSTKQPRDIMTNTTVTSRLEAESPTANLSKDDDADATTSTVTASEHGLNGVTNSGANQVAMNKNTDIVDTRESNIMVLTDVKWHATVLLLLTHVIDGRVMEAPVNANPVVSETTSRLQNTLAGNPIEANLTEGDVISSSIVSVLLTNKPNTDEMCDRVNNVSYQIVCI